MQAHILKFPKKYYGYFTKSTNGDEEELWFHNFVAIGVDHGKSLAKAHIPSPQDRETIMEKADDFIEGIIVSAVYEGDESIIIYGVQSTEDFPWVEPCEQDVNPFSDLLAQLDLENEALERKHEEENDRFFDDILDGLQRNLFDYGST